jgi:hypothetical protein
MEIVPLRRIGTVPVMIGWATCGAMEDGEASGEEYHVGIGRRSPSLLQMPGLSPSVMCLPRRCAPSPISVCWASSCVVVRDGCLHHNAEE